MRRSGQLFRICRSFADPKSMRSMWRISAPAFQSFFAAASRSSPPRRPDLHRNGHALLFQGADNKCEFVRMLQEYSPEPAAIMAGWRQWASISYTTESPIARAMARKDPGELATQVDPRDHIAFP